MMTVTFFVVWFDTKGKEGENTFDTKGEEGEMHVFTHTEPIWTVYSRQQHQLCAHNPSSDLSIISLDHAPSAITQYPPENINWKLKEVATIRLWKYKGFINS